LKSCDCVEGGAELSKVDRINGKSGCFKLLWRFLFVEPSLCFRAIKIFKCDYVETSGKIARSFGNVSLEEIVRQLNGKVSHGKGILGDQHRGEPLFKILNLLGQRIKTDQRKCARPARVSNPDGGSVRGSTVHGKSTRKMWMGAQQ